MKNLIVFLFGGSMYLLIEILWRGHTHWSMFFAGGVCFLLLVFAFSYYRNENILFKSLLGSIIITDIELIFGIIFNLIFKYNIWDYSDMKFNILGQVSLLYSFYWFCLSFVICYFFGYIEKGLKLIEKI